MISGNGQIINAGLDKQALKLELETNAFVAIPDFLEAALADRIFQCLSQEVSWELAYRNGDQAATTSQQQLHNMSAKDRQQLHEHVIEQAKKTYQFAYFRYPMLDAFLNNWTPRLMLNDVLAAFNDQPALTFLRDITGDHEVRKVELQATWYTGGHFLKLHNDRASSGDDRRYACVLGLTRDWIADWGGILQFVSNGQVTRSCTPGFNRCIIFKVPRDHQVSYVAPFATRPRYSLTGWLRAD